MTPPQMTEKDRELFREMDDLTREVEPLKAAAGQPFDTPEAARDFTDNFKRVMRARARSRQILLELSPAMQQYLASL